MEGIRARLSVPRASNTDESQLSQMIQEANPRLGPTDPDVRARIACFVRIFVDPRNIVPIIMRNNSKALCAFDQQQIERDVQNHGNMKGATTLFDRLVQHEGWFVSLTTALRDPEVKLEHAAQLIERARNEVENLGGADNEAEPSDRSEDYAEQEIENTIPKAVEAAATDRLGSVGEPTEQNHQRTEMKRPLSSKNLPRTVKFEENANQKEEFELKEEQHRITQKKYRDAKDENDRLREQMGHWKKQFELKEEQQRVTLKKYQDAKAEIDHLRDEVQKLQLDRDNLQYQLPAMKEIDILLVGRHETVLSDIGNSILMRMAFGQSCSYNGRRQTVIEESNEKISVVKTAATEFYENWELVDLMEKSMSLKPIGYNAILYVVDMGAWDPDLIKIIKQIFGETSFTKHAILLLTRISGHYGNSKADDFSKIFQGFDERVVLVDSFLRGGDIETKQREHLLEMINKLTDSNGRYTIADFFQAHITRQKLKGY